MMAPKTTYQSNHHLPVSVMCVSIERTSNPDLSSTEKSSSLHNSIANNHNKNTLLLLSPSQENVNQGYFLGIQSSAPHCLHMKTRASAFRFPKDKTRIKMIHKKGNQNEKEQKINNSFAIFFKELLLKRS